MKGLCAIIPNFTSWKMVREMEPAISRDMQQVGSTIGPDACSITNRVQFPRLWP